MLRKSKIFIISVLLLVFSTNLINFGFCDDSFGNELTGLTVNQLKAGSYEAKGLINTVNYVEGMNITVEYDFPLYFYINTLLNNTGVYYQDVPFYNAVGIQIFQNETYATGILTENYLDIGDFWLLDFETENIAYDLNEYAVVNVTNWIDYHNGSGWLLAEEWIFNILEEGEPYTPPTYSETWDLSFIWFWGMVICIFLTPMNFAIAVSNLEPKFFLYGIFTLLGVFGFYILIGGV